MAEIPLEKPVTEEQFLEKMKGAPAPGLATLAAVTLPDDAPAAMARVFAAQYALAPKPGEDEGFQSLVEALPAFLAGEHPLHPERQVRRAGGRPAPRHLQPAVQSRELHATLSLNPKLTAKPDQLLLSLSETAGVRPPGCDIRRLQLLDSRFAPEAL